MLMDSRSEFCDNVTLSTPTGTTLLGSQMNLEVARDVGQGEPIYLVIQVTTTVTSGGAATVQFDLVSDAQVAISTTTATNHLTVGPFTIADLTVGSTLAVIAVPNEGKSYEQFLGILEVVATAALTAGAVDIFLTNHPTGVTYYKDGEK